VLARRRTNGKETVAPPLLAGVYLACARPTAVLQARNSTSLSPPRPYTLSMPRKTQLPASIRPEDILCGRGQGFHRPSGILFRRIADAHRTRYKIYSHNNRGRVAARVVKICHGFGARFVRIDGQEISQAQAEEKACQRLRENQTKLSDERFWKEFGPEYVTTEQAITNAKKQVAGWVDPLEQGPFVPMKKAIEVLTGKDSVTMPIPIPHHSHFTRGNTKKERRTSKAVRAKPPAKSLRSTFKGSKANTKKTIKAGTKAAAGRKTKSTNGAKNTSATPTKKIIPMPTPIPELSKGPHKMLEFSLRSLPPYKPPSQRASPTESTTVGKVLSANKASTKPESTTPELSTELDKLPEVSLCSLPPYQAPSQRTSPTSAKDTKLLPRKPRRRTKFKSSIKYKKDLHGKQVPIKAKTSLSKPKSLSNGTPPV